MLLIVDLAGQQLLLLLALSEHHLAATHAACTRALTSCIALRSLLVVVAVVRSKLGELWFLRVVKRYRLVATAGGTLTGGFNTSGRGLILNIDTFPLGFMLALTEEIDTTSSCVEQETGIG